MTADTTPAEIVTFWREAGPDKWFAFDRAFDLVRARDADPMSVLRRLADSTDALRGDDPEVGDTFTISRPLNVSVG